MAKMTSRHALIVAARMLREQRAREERSLERLGVRGQANALRRIADIDEVITVLDALREHIAESGA